MKTFQMIFLSEFRHNRLCRRSMLYKRMHSREISQVRSKCTGWFSRSGRIHTLQHFQFAPPTNFSVTLSSFSTVKAKWQYVKFEMHKERTKGVYKKKNGGWSFYFRKILQTILNSDGQDYFSLRGGFQYLKFSGSQFARVRF